MLKIKNADAPATSRPAKSEENVGQLKFFKPNTLSFSSPAWGDEKDASLGMTTFRIIPEIAEDGRAVPFHLEHPFDEISALNWSGSAIRCNGVFYWGTPENKETGEPSKAFSGVVDYLQNVDGEQVLVRHISGYQNKSKWSPPYLFVQEFYKALKERDPVALKYSYLVEREAAQAKYGKKQYLAPCRAPQDTCIIQCILLSRGESSEVKDNCGMVLKGRAYDAFKEEVTRLRYRLNTETITNMYNRNQSSNGFDPADTCSAYNAGDISNPDPDVGAIIKLTACHNDKSYLCSVEPDSKGLDISQVNWINPADAINLMTYDELVTVCYNAVPAEVGDLIFGSRLRLLPGETSPKIIPVSGSGRMIHNTATKVPVKESAPFEGNVSTPPVSPQPAASNEDVINSFRRKFNISGNNNV